MTAAGCRPLLDAALLFAFQSCRPFDLPLLLMPSLSSRIMSRSRPAFPACSTSNAGVASALINLERYGLGLDYYRRYPDLIRSITPADVPTEQP